METGCKEEEKLKEQKLKDSKEEFSSDPIGFPAQTDVRVCFLESSYVSQSFLDRNFCSIIKVDVKNLTNVHFLYLIVGSWI